MRQVARRAGFQRIEPRRRMRLVLQQAHGLVGRDDLAQQRGRRIVRDAAQAVRQGDARARHEAVDDAPQRVGIDVLGMAEMVVFGQPGAQLTKAAGDDVPYVAFRTGGAASSIPWTATACRTRRWRGRRPPPAAR